MFLRDVASAVKRRWYLVILGVLATAVLSLAAIKLFPPTYEATSSVVLLPPQSSVSVGGNPYLELGGLETVADVAARALSSQSVVEAVAASSPNGSYTVSRDFATSGPILLITANGTSAKATMLTLKTVSDLVNPTLTELQTSANIDVPAQISSSVLTADGHAESVKKSTIRALIAASALGLIASALLIALFDGLLLKRGARKDSEGPAAPDSLSGTAPGSDGAALTEPTEGRRRIQSSSWGNDAAVINYPTEVVANQKTANPPRHRSVRRPKSIEVAIVDSGTDAEDQLPSLESNISPGSTARRRIGLNPSSRRPAVGENWPESTRPGR